MRHREMAWTRTTPSLQRRSQHSTHTHGGTHESLWPSAIHGEGVLETLHGLLGMTHQRLEERLQLASQWGLPKKDFIDRIFSGFDLSGSPLATAR